MPSAIVWATVWGVLGYTLGGSWRALQEAAGAAAFLVLALFFAALVIRWLAARIAANRRRVQSASLVLLRATGLPLLARGLAPARVWLGRRFDPRIARGLGLTVGFGALIGATAGVGLLMLQMQAVWGLALLDFPALEWMAEARTAEAIRISRLGLTVLHWPEVIGLAIPLVAVLAWRSGATAALRVGVGLLGATAGAYFLDRLVFEGVVPHAEYPSVPVAAASALMAHAAAGAARRWGWRPSVAVGATGFFLVCTVALATIVAGWAAPTGIVMGFAVGLGWATTLELPRAFLASAGAATASDPPPDVPRADPGDPRE